MSGDEWTFTSIITRPDGYRVEVTITAPEYRDVREQGEIAHMGANTTLTYHTQAIERNATKEPF